jgi:hypothetical protein
MNDYNQRQLANMLNQLAAFEDRSIDLAGLISSLESLLNALENMPEPWMEQIRRRWGVLEEVYSIAVVREQPIESTENRVLVDQAIKEIKGLISVALREP